jgi:hypothetical protein
MADLVIHIPNQVPRKYPVPENFTYRELQTIKTVTGLRPAEFEEALGSDDPDIVIALAMICAKRAGHIVTPDDLLDLEIGGITIEGDDEADPTTAGDVNEETPATTPENGGTPALPESTG